MSIEQELPVRWTSSKISVGILVLALHLVAIVMLISSLQYQQRAIEAPAFVSVGTIVPRRVTAPEEHWPTHRLPLPRSAHHSEGPQELQEPPAIAPSSPPTPPIDWGQEAQRAVEASINRDNERAPGPSSAARPLDENGPPQFPGDTLWTRRFDLHENEVLWWVNPWCYLYLGQHRSARDNLGMECRLGKSPQD